MKVAPFFRWYDLWIGAYWDRDARSLYVCPLPCLGVRIEFPKQPDGVVCGYCKNMIVVDYPKYFPDFEESLRRHYRLSCLGSQVP